MNLCIKPDSSPLPWKYIKVPNNEDMFFYYEIVDATGYFITDVSEEEKAKLIVHYANSHAALVEQIGETLALLRTGLAPDGMFAKEEDWLRHKCNKAAGELAAALAAAKGEK